MQGKGNKNRVEYESHESEEYKRQSDGRQQNIHHILLKNCNNCKRTDLHSHIESLSLTRMSESNNEQNKKEKFSMLAGESWDDCHLCSSE